MQDEDEIQAMIDIAYQIAERSDRFNAETRIEAKATAAALEWVLGNIDPPYSADDLA